MDNPAWPPAPLTSDDLPAGRPWPPVPATTGDLPQAPSGWVVPAPRAPSRFRSSATRARLAIAALIAILFVNLVEILHLSSFDGILAAYSAGTIEFPVIQQWDELSLALDRLYLGVFIGAGITFLAWLSRAVDNAPSIGAGVPPRSPRGAIFWWFVPFANLVVPYQIVADLHRRLAPSPDIKAARLLLIGWWVTYILGNLFAYVPIVLLMGESLEVVRLGITTSVISNVFDAVAAFLAILVILSIQRREDARAATHAGNADAAVQLPATPAI